MDKRQAIGGAFRFLLTGGSWMRLAMWVKASPARGLTLSLQYPSGSPVWKLCLSDVDGIRFEGENTSLEGVTVEAVAALGKSL